jgi:hypothetical protein
MTELDPTAIDIAKIEADYDKALARLATIKAMRRIKRRDHKDAIAAALTAEPTATNVDLAARFAVTEGTVRKIRRTTTPVTPETPTTP